MATQDELDWENAASRNQQKENRERRSAEREVKDRRQELLQGATSTKERRQIKAGVYDLSTRPDDNKEGTDERIQNDGIDRITSAFDEGGGGGGGLPDGYEETAIIFNESGTLYNANILLELGDAI